MLRKLFAVVVVLWSLLAFASFACPVHPTSQCYSNGQVKYVNGQKFEMYRCNPCGDTMWVK